MDPQTQKLIENLQSLTSDPSKISEVSNMATSLFGFSMTGLIISFLFSMVGIFYFRYGKKEQSFVFMISGVALMLYPYIVSDTLYIILVGLVVSGIPFILKRFV